MVADFTVCARANADVVAKLPVVGIVLTLMARLRIRRDLVVAQTIGRQLRLYPLLHINRQFIIGHSWRMLVKKSIRLDGQMVVGQMRRLITQGNRHIGFELCQGLIGQGKHQIKIYFVKQLIRRIERRARVFARMNASNARQHRIVKTLHADRQTSHARRMVIAQFIGVQSPWIGLHRDLHLGHLRQTRAHCG